MNSPQHSYTGERLNSYFLVIIAFISDFEFLQRDKALRSAETLHTNWKSNWTVDNVIMVMLVFLNYYDFNINQAQNIE